MVAFEGAKYKTSALSFYIIIVISWNILTLNLFVMKTNFSFLVLLIFSLTFITSCKKDDPDPGSVPAGTNVVIINDDITAVTTWSSDSVYIINDNQLWIENTLVIEPGTIIKLKSSAPDILIAAGGTINANGTADNPIIFTSYKDDAHGGDNNGDGTATSPASEDWGGVGTNGENGSIFNFCEFYYGGSGSYSYSLQVYGNNIQVTHCTFAHNSGDDASGWYGALEANDAESDCQINNNVFYDNVRPFSVSTAISIDNTNIFHNPEDPSVLNEYNGIFVESINDITAAISWSETEVPFVIDDNDWWIDEGASLSLANNVVLKFRSGSAMVLADGVSSLVNHNGTGVVFTSYKDDTYLGDTNADGSATSPSVGDWDGIYDNVTGDNVHWTNMHYESVAN